MTRTNEDIYRQHFNTIDRCLTNLSAKTSFSKPQLLALSILPIIIVTGQFMSVFSPEETVNNYFTSKGNLFNRFFVKFGWFWTIITYINILFRKKLCSNRNTTTLFKSITRVLIITSGWYLFTQWFFGLPIMDRIFILTGGKCDNISESNVPHQMKSLLQKSLSDPNNYTSSTISSATCRIIRGSWGGGHDPSGHIFLLTVSINLLVWETVELWTDESEIINKLSNVSSLKMLLVEPIFITGFMVLLELMTFLMTIIKYHTLSEQLGGFIFAVALLWVTTVINGSFKL